MSARGVRVHTCTYVWNGGGSPLKLPRADLGGLGESGRRYESVGGAWESLGGAWESLGGAWESLGGVVGEPKRIAHVIVFVWWSPGCVTILRQLIIPGGPP